MGRNEEKSNPPVPAQNQEEREGTPDSAAPGFAVLDKRHAAETIPFVQLFAPETNCPALLSIHVPEEVLEVASEIVAPSHGPGIAQSSLLYLIQAIVYWDRLQTKR